MITIDEQIGYRVRQALWRSRRTQTELARELGIDQASISRRLRGTVAWRVSDVMAAANLCGVDYLDLLPQTARQAVSA